MIVAGAGGAAHLPGMIASATALPVIGVPVARPAMDGLDSLLSIAVQMPAGIPVATMAIDGAANGAAGGPDPRRARRPPTEPTLVQHRAELRQAVADKDARITRAWTPEEANP